MKCPKCGKEIDHVDFCGDAYYGTYGFNEEHTFNFTCPECGDAIIQVRKTFTEEDLTDKLDDVI